MDFPVHPSLAVTSRTVILENASGNCPLHEGGRFLQMRQAQLLMTIMLHRQTRTTTAIPAAIRQTTGRTRGPLLLGHG